MEQNNPNIVPPFSEFTFRHLSGPDDGRFYIALIKACERVDRIDQFSTQEHIPTYEEISAYFETCIPQNVLFAEMNGEVIAVTSVSRWIEADGTQLYQHQGRVHPSYRGRGLGTTMLHWAEAQISTLSDEHYSHKKVSFGVKVSSTEKAAASLLQYEGYAPFWTGVEMELLNFSPILNTTQPNKFIFRPIASDQYFTIWGALQRFWGHTLASSISTQEDYQEFVTLVSSDSMFWYVLWNENQPVALLSCQVKNRCGIIDQLIVDPQYRRQGLGQVLVQNALTSLHKQGIQRMRLFTDINKQYGTRSLAEKLGFNIVKTFSQYRKSR